MWIKNITKKQKQQIDAMLKTEGGQYGLDKSRYFCKKMSIHGLTGKNQNMAWDGWLCIQ